MKYTFLLRTCAYMEQRAFLFPVYLLARMLLRHYRFYYGISIPFSLSLGSGFFVSHPGDIVVSVEAVIGQNFNISQGVTIGWTPRGKHPGAATIGDNTYIGPGAKIIGGVKIGSNVAIGANCVVTDDIPDNAVVVGVPGRVISENGAAEYILNPWHYDCQSNPPTS